MYSLASASYRRPVTERARRRRLVLDLATCAALFAVTAPITLRFDEVGAGTHLDTLLLPAVIAPILLRHRAPLAAAAALAAGCLVSAIPTFDQFRLIAAVAAATLIVFALATRADRSRALAGLALVLAGMLVVGATESVLDGIGGVGAMALFSFPLCIGVWVGGRLVRARGLLADDLAERSRLLEHRRAETAQLAVEIERALLESDIDEAARTSLRQIVELADTATRALDGDTDHARDALARVESLARDTLNAMRRLLGVLHSDERAGPAPRPTPHSAVTAAAGSSYRRAARRDVAIAVAVFASVAADVVLGGPTLSGVVLAYVCGAHAPRRLGRIGVALVMAGWQLAMGFADFPNVEIAVLCLPPWFIGAELRSRRALVHALAERNRQLEAEEDALARLSVRRERARVAHELHDVVGHHLAVIAVQACAGQVALGSENGVAAESLAAIRASGLQAIEDLVRLTDILQTERDEDPTALAQLPALLDRARAGGRDVRYHPLGGDVRLPRDAEDTALHVVQEAVTNAIKHAPGAAIDVRVRVADGELEIDVRDGGASAASALAATGSGMGLAGIAERVEALGGRLDAGRQADGGWRIHARVPVGRSAPAVGTAAERDASRR